MPKLTPEQRDTSKDAEAERRWQALVQGVIDAKAAAVAARAALVDADVTLAPHRREQIETGTPMPADLVARFDNARAAYKKAGETVDKAAQRMKAGLPEHQD